LFSFEKETRKEKRKGVSVAVYALRAFEFKKPERESERVRARARKEREREMKEIKRCLPSSMSMLMSNSLGIPVSRFGGSSFLGTLLFAMYVP